MRDKALVSLLRLCGPRVAAIATLRFKHVDFDKKCVKQNPHEVATKFGKPIYSFFHKGFSEAETALAKWMIFLDDFALYGPDDPLFPATPISAKGTDGFKATGVERRHWSSTEPIRKIANTAFNAAGLEPYGPHSFRQIHSRHISRY